MNESRDSEIKIGTSWRVTPSLKAAFDAFRADYSYTRVTDALHYLLSHALMVLGYASNRNRQNVAVCRLDAATERRLDEAEAHGMPREQALSIMLRYGGAVLERSGYEDWSRAEAEAPARMVG